MEWEQFAIMVVAFVGLFIWNRTESRTDIRHMDSKLESNRALTTAFHEAIRQDIREFNNKLITQDMEFKSRLCSIEERAKNVEPRPKASLTK